MIKIDMNEDRKKIQDICKKVNYKFDFHACKTKESARTLIDFLKEKANELLLVTKAIEEDIKKVESLEKPKVESSEITYDPDLFKEIEASHSGGGRNQELFFIMADFIEKYPTLYDPEIVSRGVPSAKQHSLITLALYLDGFAGQCSYLEQHEPHLPTAKNLARDLLRITDEEADTLFDPHWEPKRGRTVSEVLKGFGRGAMVE